jgi:hypothetical protein
LQQVVLEKMVAGASDEEDAAGTALDPEVLPPLPAAEAIVIDPTEPLLPVGSVSAVVEGMLVVQVGPIDGRKGDAGTLMVFAPGAALQLTSVPVGDLLEVFWQCIRVSDARRRVPAACCPAWCICPTGPRPTSELLESGSQARELTRALDIESVLCLGDRTPLGRVEEVRIKHLAFEGLVHTPEFGSHAST